MTEASWVFLVTCWDEKSSRSLVEDVDNRLGSGALLRVTNVAKFERLIRPAPYGSTSTQPYSSPYE